MATDWPLVLNHFDTLKNNTNVNPSTGKLMSTCGGAGTQISPIGMPLGGVENIIGISKENDHDYHTNHNELHELFYDELYGGMGLRPLSECDKKPIGLFLPNDWRYDENETQLRAGGGDHMLCPLDGLLQATCDGNLMGCVAAAHQ